MVYLKDLSYRTILFFSLPSICASLLEPLASVVDSALVGRINTAWLAALALSLVILNGFTWLFNFLSHATTQAVADGGGRGKEVMQEQARIALTASILVGVSSSIVVWLIRYLLYKFVGVTEEMIPLVDSYTKIRIIGQPVVFVYITLLSILRGLGRVKTGFILIVLTTATNIMLTYLFLYIMKTGIEGAAYGTVISNIVGLVLSVSTLYKCGRLKGINAKIRLDWNKWNTFWSNGRDLLIRIFMLTLSFFISFRLASSMGVKVVAAHQIVLQIYLFSSYFIDGMAISGTILGADLAARGKIKRLRWVFRRLLHMSLLIGTVFTVIYGLGGEWLIGIFSNDTEVVSLCLSVWPLIYLSQLICAAAFTYDGFMFGLGEFLLLRKHIGIAVLLIFIPLTITAWNWPWYRGIFGDSLWVIWPGIIAINIYRVVALGRRLKKL